MDKPKKVLVCGSRYWEDEYIIDVILSGLEQKWRENEETTWTIIDGAAPGADSIAGEWNKANIEHERYPALWDQYGKAAGPIRNTQMLQEGQPDLVLAFSNNLEESKGTRNMVTQAQKAGVPVYIIGKTG